MSLNGEIAIVTGASRGIGKSIAEALGKAGATVVGTATSDKGAAGIDEHFKSAGIEGGGLVLNVSEADSIAEFLKAATEKFGTPTILVNNAGITRDNLLMRMKDDEWDAVIQTNLSSIFRLSKGVMRGMMKAKKGRIINIASVVGLIGNPGQANYCAAKAGIVGFTKSMAREIGSRGITVNVVAPGFIDTDMTKELPEESRKAMLSQVPLERLGSPDDIAQAVLFLAGPGAGYITGETINVNGGMYMP
ncbi:MAG: 3-oxoacyl-ACP reductase FabG [Gammaproteobacteria bacterium]|nr:3-oxoacyl-ACP reductase FabG [Gammaproteobacteria bacterium]